MTLTRITEPGDLYGLPVGAVICHESALNGVEAAVKTCDGTWLVTGDRIEYDPDSLFTDSAWAGAEVYTPARIAQQAAAMAAALRQASRDGGAAA